MKAILDVKLVNTVVLKKLKKKIEDLISELCDCAICLVFFSDWKHFAFDWSEQCRVVSLLYTTQFHFL